MNTPIDSKLLKAIGNVCKEYRISNLGVPQMQVAIDLHLSQTAICLFEQGKRDSARMLSWYLKKGLTWDRIEKEIEKNEE